MNGIIYQEVITIIIMFTLNISTFDFTRNTTEHKSTDRPQVLDDFNTPFSPNT
jgi:hypothetical protein